QISQGLLQPSEPRISASMTELHFNYEIVAPGPLQGTTGEIVARACSRCSSFAPSFNKELNVWESQIEITGLALSGEDQAVSMAITMDERMQPYDWMQPLDKSAPQFQFPAKMQLNNSMILKTRVKATGETMTLVSRDVPCQAGRVTNWPPYGVRLHTQREITYYDSNDPLGQPVVKILDGTTYLTGPAIFFLHRPDILEYEYIPAQGERDLPAVRLTWRAMPVGIEGADLHDHYHVHRTSDPEQGEAGWQQVSGHAKDNTWVDPNPPRAPLYYRVACVLRTGLGDDYEGPPGQTRRVEPAASVFRV